MITVSFTKPWSWSEDSGGNVSRQFPSGWRGELTDELASEAIADKAAEPVKKLSKDQAAGVAELIEARETARQEAEQRAQIAEAIRADAAKVINASDEELIAMAVEAEQGGDAGSAPVSGSGDAG